MDQIQRHGVWWTRDPAGGWLRFDPAAGGWQPSTTPPPPPPPPPPAVPAAESGAPSSFPYDPRFYVPLEKKKRTLPRFGHNLDPRVAMAAAGLLALLMLGGAGWMVLGDDGAAPVAALSLDDSEDLSKKQRFIRAADGICANLMTVAGKIPLATDLSEVVDILHDIRDEVWVSYGKLKALKPPAKARKAWKRYIGTPADFRVFDDMIAAAERGDVATLQSLAKQLESGPDKTDRWAKRYGFKVCSQDF